MQAADLTTELVLMIIYFDDHVMHFVLRLCLTSLIRTLLPQHLEHTHTHAHTHTHTPVDKYKKVSKPSTTTAAVVCEPQNMKK